VQGNQTSILYAEAAFQSLYDLESAQLIEGCNLSSGRSGATTELV
jgi:hypothetical protein